MQSGSWGFENISAEMPRSRSRPARWLERMVFKASLIRGGGGQGDPRGCIWSDSERGLPLVFNVLHNEVEWQKVWSEMCPVIVLLCDYLCNMIMSV